MELTVGCRNQEEAGEFQIWLQTQHLVCPQLVALLRKEGPAESALPLQGAISEGGLESPGDSAHPEGSPTAPRKSPKLTNKPA